MIHCTATKEGRNLPLIGLRAMHQARGFRDVGYHYYILRDGKVELGRPVEQIGAHVQGHNTDSIGVAYEGGLNAYGKPEDTRTPKQKEALKKLIKDLKNRFGRVPVMGHRDLSPDLDGDGVVERHEWLKECPCFDAKIEYNEH